MVEAAIKERVKALTEPLPDLPSKVQLNAVVPSCNSSRYAGEGLAFRTEDSAVIRPAAGVCRLPANFPVFTTFERVAAGRET